VDINGLGAKPERKPKIKKGGKKSKAAGCPEDAAAAGKPGEDEPTKPNTLVPGPFAGKSIPARGPESKFTPEERAAINRIGKDTGCHSCSSTDPKTKSGNFIPDHQPPSQLNPEGASQRLFPHCNDCRRLQGGQVNGAKTRKP
jgi:hypothetical protein